MFKKGFKLIFRNKLMLNYGQNMSDDAGKGLLFFTPEIQELLQKLATPQLDEAFPVRKIGERLKPPEYKFLTDSEVKAVFKQAQEKSKRWMQMPPVVDARSQQDQVIEVNSALDGADRDGASMVFTDITYGIKDEDRLIVVREPDGTLRHADWETRARLTETYLPRPGREITPPPMFYDEHLESLLERKEYKFVLDRACAQFEPDDSEYIRITSAIYKKVAKDGDFSTLRGTRHFGSMIFYLVFNKNVDTLLLDNLQNDRLEDTVSLIHLYHMIHPDSASATSPAEGAALIKAFIAQEFTQRNALELALQTCIERLQERKHQVETIEKAHGVQV